MDSEQRMSVIGLTLGEARDALQSQPQTLDWRLHIVETAPPVRPTQPARPLTGFSSSSRTTKKMEKKSERRPQQWGEWRVLRCRSYGLAEGNAAIELLVAREELGTVQLPIADLGIVDTDSNAETAFTENTL
jgi:hypothetical protein